MMRLIKSLLLSSLIGSLGILMHTSVYADTVSFEVSVDPSTITAGEFTDLEIKAIGDDGNIDTGYTDDIFIQIDGLDIDDPDVELPGKGFGFFETSDQGQKIYSKGITIKKAGTYTVTVVDTFLNTVKGSAVLTVNQEGSAPSLGTLDVTSPVADSILTTDTVSVAATTSLPNTSIVLYIDGDKVQEGLSDANGDVTMSVSGLEPGTHTLTMNAVDLSGTIVATSDEIPFTYEGDEDHGSLFVGLELTPSNSVIEGEKVTAKITTADVVDTVTIKIGDGAPLPTSKISAGIFQKELLMEAVGSYPVGLGLSVDGSVTDMTDVDTITVTADIQKILTLTATPDTTSDKVGLNWTYEGNIEFFKLQYGMNKSNLDLSLTTTTPTANILLTDPTKTRYVSVTPVDTDGTATGDPSDTIQIDPLRDPDPVCGNGVVESGEECDDNNTSNGDGCSAVCRIQTAICGNRRIELGEECDDGNINNADGCSSSCKIEQATCGNGRLELGEECDDGNTLDTDTCSNACTIVIQEEIQECETGGIEISTKIVGGKYYLYRSPVNNAQKYLVYRQETRPGTISDMRLVGETTDPLFEYPFDPTASVDQYAWYAVEAVCDHSSASQLGDFTKVKVGPEETMIMILLGVILLRGMMKLQGKKY